MSVNMKRTQQGRILLFALLSLSFIASAAPKISVGPYLQHVTQSNMVVMFETDVPCVASVRYGKVRFWKRGDKKKPTDADLMKLTTPLSSKQTIHRFVLSNLDAQSDYFYQASYKGSDGKDIYSSKEIFQTAVRKDSAFSFVVMGDTRSNVKIFSKLCSMALAEHPNFVINVGDIVQDGRKKSQWASMYFKPAAALMKRVPTYVAIGNHERNAEWYYKYSGYPAPQNYYSFDYGNAHFTIIDSNASLKKGSKQYNWLIADLEKSKNAKWKFVAHHHPPYSSDADDYGKTTFWLSKRGDSRVQSLIPIYEKYGIDVVWSGHVHDYERTWPLRDGKVDEKNGVIYIQAGGGGAELEQFAPTRSWFTAKLLRNWQYCYVVIHDGTFQMMAYDIDGKLYDLLTLKK